MRFQFRLEKMLHFIQMRETQKKTELAAIVNEISLLGRAKETLSEEVLKLIEDSHRGLENGMAAAAYQTVKIAFNVKESKRIDKLIDEEQQKLEKKKRDVARLSLKRKALENLKEQRRKEFRVAQDRKSQKTLDETHSLLERQATEKKPF